jgi:hypothetical protein
MKLNFLCKDGWRSNHIFFEMGHNETPRMMATIYGGAGRIYRKMGFTFEKKCD